MTSPSSPFEYTPTYQLCLIIFFVVFPLIYILGRFVLATLTIALYITKSMLSPVTNLLFIDDDDRPFISSDRENVLIEESSESEDEEDISATDELTSSVAVENEKCTDLKKNSSEPMNKPQRSAEWDRDSGTGEETALQPTDTDKTSNTDPSNTVWRFRRINQT
ncbi:hypothetical protein AB6A40_001561 [Gnathostoma spinigerum]|uniref:Uncharacterized protein n=1 Tax=Gnathostoma spinigerum TaxID=75299 RepID=A0ABD6EDT0_9BILA